MLCLLICIMFMFQGRVAYVMSVNLYNVHVSGSCGLVMSVNLYNVHVSGPCGLCYVC